MVTMLIALGQT